MTFSSGKQKTKQDSNGSDFSRNSNSSWCAGNPESSENENTSTTTKASNEVEFIQITKTTPIALSKLSDTNFESALKDLIKKEKLVLHEVLLHICELERRKLYLARAFTSLFDYLTRELGYCESSANIRIKAVRLMMEMPDIHTKVKDGSLKLTQLAQASRAFTEKEKETGAKVDTETKREVLAALENQTGTETQHTISVMLDLELKPADKIRIQKDRSRHLNITLSDEEFELFENVRNSVDSDRPFRFIAIDDFGSRRQVISVHSDRLGAHVISK